MQVIYKNKDKGNNSRGTDLVDAVICTRGISRCLKEKYTGGFRSRVIRIWDGRRVFGRYQERVWRRRQRRSKSSKVEKVGIRK